MELTKEQIDIVRPLMPKPSKRKDGKGRPRRDPIEILMGIMWILRTGAPWKDLPKRYPPYQTCHRRYQEWIQKGVLSNLLKTLAVDLEKSGKLDLKEGFIDGSFSSAKKGALKLVERNVEKGVRSWQLQTAMVFLSLYPQQVLRHMR